MKCIIKFVSCDKKVVRVYAANVDLSYFSARQWHNMRTSFFDFYKVHPNSTLVICVNDNTPF